MIGISGQAIRGHKLYEEYNGLNNMSAEDTNIYYTKQIVTLKQNLIKGDLSGLLKENEGLSAALFLGLLCNNYDGDNDGKADGIYHLGSTFVPESNDEKGGKKVEYPDLYGGTATVVDLLLNGAEMLDTLLRSHNIGEGNNLEQLADAMKVMLYKYVNGIYPITDPLDIYPDDEEEYEVVGGGSVGGGHVMEGKPIVNTEQVIK